MIDRFLYLVSEGIRSLWRTKTTALATISAIGIAASFVVFSAVVGENISGIIQIARGQYEFQVFFSEDVDNIRAAELVDQIDAIEGIKSASLITKEEAADIFQREFGENIFDLLEENPLPPGSVLKLQQPKDKRIDVNPIIKQIELVEGVDEVRYQGRLISFIERYYEGFFAAVTALAAAILFGTVILISNTIRLSIYARRDLIRILKLVGATDRFVRFPFMIEGILEGFFGSLVAAAVSYGFVEGSNYFLSLFTQYRLVWQFQIVALLVGVIVFFSFVGSMRAVRKFL
ncbi:MAG: permease-like cell division protein FtsX [Candidatus Marinimicrobia bacterium]|jgi:cell division transport system permease protein|nr:permease-like cell division protein FtsX [Candidatus Neomarinimicrobiota bacterium]MDP7059979.1 permease-like cell division protein FtsX [Candidatus Neomarinimicrobiota bacterium]|tara:strand:+ start:283 stop:1149 length:867 start_codon:yes stop_codon:yes gene_type:complete